jgi:hypothetical protein
MEDTARRAPDLSPTSAGAGWGGKTTARSGKLKFFFYPERAVLLAQLNGNRRRALTRFIRNCGIAQESAVSWPASTASTAARLAAISAAE